MKNIIKCLMLISIIGSNLFAVSYPVSDPNTWNFSYNPFKAYYQTMGGYHPGTDFDKGNSAGKSVYPIADGTIYAKSSYNSKIGGGIVIKHNINNKTYYSLYYHVNIPNNLPIGKDVHEGTSFTTIADISSFGDHLHLEVRTKFKSSDWYPNDRGNGYYSTKNLIDTDGIIDPIAFIKNNTSISYSGIFDGAGSLVSSDESCWGCDKDEARMHPHNGTGSTVVFQWLYDSNSCTQIDLTANKDIDVVVKQKFWNDHTIKSAFKVKLGSRPITLRRTDSSSPWTTLAITSTSSINSEVNIYAHCKIPGDTYRSGGRVNVEKNLVDVTSDTFWTGTGSLISSANQGNLSNFGTGKDYAITYNSHNSLTSFQWFATDNCEKIKVEDVQGNNSSSSIKSVHMKSWNVSSWGSNKCSSLPCTLSASYIGNYYIIKVKSGASGVSSNMLKATCVQ